MLSRSRYRTYSNKECTILFFQQISKKKPPKLINNSGIYWQWGRCSTVWGWGDENWRVDFDMSGDNIEKKATDQVMSTSSHISRKQNQKPWESSIEFFWIRQGRRSWRVCNVMLHKSVGRVRETRGNRGLRPVVSKNIFFLNRWSLETIGLVVIGQRPRKLPANDSGIKTILNMRRNISAELRAD
jgi:hypothetical protein